jgi:predicted  nucleic acid-binding Zn-ribbon protein
VKEQIDLLVLLQEKDQTLDQLKQQIRQGPEQIRELEGQIETLEKDFECEKGRIKELRKWQRQQEAEVEDGAAQINKAEGRLLAIKSNKEYQALLIEIENAGKVKAKKEDEILHCMEEIERLNKAHKDKDKSLAVNRESFEKEKLAIKNKVSRDQKQLCELEKRRADRAKTIRPEILSKYEQLRERGGDLAVVLVENTTCSGCHLNIPAQMYNELQRMDSLKLCPHCNRIIYWKESTA